MCGTASRGTLRSEVKGEARRRPPEDMSGEESRDSSCIPSAPRKSKSKGPAFLAKRRPRESIELDQPMITLRIASQMPINAAAEIKPAQIGSAPSTQIWCALVPGVR